jgi:hypothetical protein
VAACGCLCAHLDCQVFVHQQVGGLEVAVDDGGLAGVQEVLGAVGGGVMQGDLSREGPMVEVVVGGWGEGIRLAARGGK